MIWFFSNKQPTFRLATPSDTQDLSTIHKQNFAKGWNAGDFAQMLNAQNNIIHVAQIKSKVVGFIASRIAHDEAEILSVAIAKNMQGYGIASKMLKPHLSKLAQEGVQKLFLEVEENNQPAIALYNRYGFVEIGKRNGYYSSQTQTLNALTMRLDL